MTPLFLAQDPGGCVSGEYPGHVQPWTWLDMSVASPGTREFMTECVDREM